MLLKSVENYFDIKGYLIYNKNMCRNKFEYV